MRPQHCSNTQRNTGGDTDQNQQLAQHVVAADPGTAAAFGGEVGGCELLGAPFIFNEGCTVSESLAEHAERAGVELAIDGFVRWAPEPKTEC